MTLAVGTVLCDKYEIGRTIGTGGSGAVYEARHGRLNKSVAIKVLSAGASGDLLARREALAGSIKSRNVVEIYDIDVDPVQNVQIIVMEYLEGNNLGKIVEAQGRLDEDEALTVLRQVLAGVGRAHDRGIVHGDLKPGNVYCTSTAGDERVVVLDFGIASLSESGIPSLTRTLGGTTAWMDPDALAGRPRTRAADTWGIGLLAYYVLVGRVYWDPTAHEDLVRAILDGPKVAPSSKALSRGVTVPPWLDKLFAAALNERVLGTGDLEGLLPASATRVPRFRAAAGSDTAAGQEQNLALETTHLNPRLVSLGYSDQTDVLMQLQSEVEEPLLALDQILPATMRGHARGINGFVTALFETMALRGDIVRLRKPKITFAKAYEFFLIALSSTRASSIQTMTFVGYTKSLEQMLQRLDREALKVVIVLVDTTELGLGVRTRIAELFRTYGAALIPAYIGDVVAAQAPETARAWLQHRWQTNRPVTNPFESRIFDQTLFQGQQDVVQRYAPELLSADAVAIHGAPGAGKSSLLRRLQAELRSDAEFVWLSCSFLPPGGAAAEFLRRAAETFQTPYEVVNGVPVDSFTAGLTKFLGDAGNKPSRTVIVLDDADVLVAPALYGMTPADIQFFEDLKHQIDLALRGHGISFVFVGLRTFMLTREEIDGVSNPLRPYVLPLRVPPLNKADVGSICDLGKQVDLYFEPEAVERVYYWSSGNAHVVQMMCGKILENSPKNELTTVTEAMVDSAASELISARQTLERRVMPGLTAIERKILAVVARFSISKPIDFEWALPDVPDEQVGNALDCLVEIGVLSRRGGKTKVEGPLLEAWVKTHMQLPTAAKNERRNRQIRLATLGAVMSILAFTVGGLAFAAGEQFVLSPEVGGCTMKVKLPKRVEAKGTLEIMLFRRCRSPKTGLVELGKRAETRAEFFAPGAVKGERKAIAWHVEDADDSESFTVRNIDGIAPYWFGLNYSADEQPKKEVLLFSVERNWLSALPNGAQAVMVAAGALPTLIGLLLAFYGDVRRLLGKFFEGSGKATAGS